jgi:hypothetical protein
VLTLAWYLGVLIGRIVFLLCSIWNITTTVIREFRRNGKDWVALWYLERLGR